MKNVIFVLAMLATSTSIAWDDRYTNEDNYYERVARERADAHPQGSGVGSNEYTKPSYVDDYKVDSYKRDYNYDDKD